MGITRISLFFAGLFSIALTAVADENEHGTHGFAQSGDVKIHYVTDGEGPLLVLIHGFPDYWYSWREQMPALADHFKVVAIDQRGYNKSGQPNGVSNYTMDKLVGDVKAVIEHFGREQATIVGHDWGRSRRVDFCDDSTGHDGAVDHSQPSSLQRPEA